MRKLGFTTVVISLFAIGLFTTSSFTDISEEADKPQIKWMTMAEATQANEKLPKKIFFDVYTEWCGWCKRMDATTFQHPKVIEYMNQNFYAVKFDAESTKEITVHGKKYGSSNSGKPRAPHQFAVEMLQGKMSYPSFAVYDESLKNIGIIPGFQSAKDLEKILNYFGSNAHKKMSWQDFSNSFNSEIK